MLTRELNDAREQLKYTETKLQAMGNAVEQQMENNERLTTKIETMERENTSKLEVLFFVSNFLLPTIVADCQQLCY